MVLPFDCLMDVVMFKHEELTKTFLSASINGLLHMDNIKLGSALILTNRVQCQLAELNNKLVWNDAL